MAWYTVGGKVVITAGGQIGDSGITSFNFYISPTGDDNNPGNFASPWSITALNSKGSTYAGKRVGMLPGVYQYGTIGGVQTSIYTLCQNINGGAGANPGAHNALNINGGTSASTYLASSDASGNYSPRTAAILPTDLVTGVRTTSECGVIGQDFTSAQPNLGKVIIDGLVIHKWFQWAIAFFPSSASAYPTSNNTGIVVKNCEIYDGVGNGNDNSSPIVFQACSGAYAGYNLLHDHTKSVGTGNDIAGLYSFSCYSNIYEYNTIYNTGFGLYDKNYPNGNHTHRYNFIEGSTGNTIPSPIQDCTGGQSGDVFTCHHNILYVVGAGAQFGAIVNGSGIIPTEVEKIIFYNNTCVYNTNGCPGIFFQKNTGVVSQYNNIELCLTTGTQGLITVYAGGYTAPCDYNTYGSSNGTPLMGHVAVAGTGVPTLVQLSQWKTDLGLDVSSRVGTDTFAGTLGVQNASNYQLVSGASINGGKVGGVSSGATINSGAWDGLVAQIGCGYSASLEITTTSITNAVVGTAFSFTVNAAGGTGPYVYSILKQNPNTQQWRYITQAGVLYGTPQLDESGPVTLQVTDSTGATATSTLTHTVTNTGTLSISSPTNLPNGTVNGGYFYQLIATGGTAPYQNWTVSSNTGTNTWFVTPDGWLYGVPTTAETDTVTLACADITDASASITVTIVVGTTITLSGIDYTLAAIKIPDGRAGTKYSHQLRPADGGTGTGQVFSVSSGGFPTGITMSSAGLISGTPTNSGNALVSIEVTDSGSNVTTPYPIQWNITSRQIGTRPAGNTASGFYVSTAGDLCDTNTNIFIPRGINRLHYDQTSSGYPTTGTNAVRYCMYLSQFRGTNPGGSQTASTYFGNANSQHVANKQFPLVTAFYAPGTGTGTSGTTTVTYPALSAAWMIDNLATWVSSGLQNNAAFNIVNEWGNPIGGFLSSSTWRDAYLYVAEPIANITGNVITLASSVTGASNPFTAAVNGGWATIAGNSGNSTGAFAISAVGGSSGAWTVTTAGATNGTGGTLYGGAIGILRGGGFTDPIVIDAGNFGQSLQDFLVYGVAVAQSDPEANTLLSFHSYGLTSNLQSPITTVSSGSNAIITFNWTGASHPFNWPSGLQVTGAAGSGLYTKGVTGAAGINGIHLQATATSGSSPWTITTTFTAPTSGSGGMGIDWYHVYNVGTLLAGLKASGIGVLFGEFGPGRTANNSLTSIGQTVTATEQNQFGEFYWAMDDGGLFGACTSPGTYLVPIDLTQSGLDSILNPRYGITCLAQPASSY